MMKTLRMLTTESTAVFMPFKTQKVMDDGGLLYGVNAMSHTLILCHRKYLQNGNGRILGVAGVGKSFFAKLEMILNALYKTSDVHLLPPEQYIPLILPLADNLPENIHITSLKSDGNNIRLLDSLMSRWSSLSSKGGITSELKSENYLLNQFGTVSGDAADSKYGNSDGSGRWKEQLRGPKYKSGGG